VSIPEFLTIIKVSVTAVVAYTFASFLLSRGTNVPRSVPCSAGMYLIAGLPARGLPIACSRGSILPTSVLKDPARSAPQRAAARHDDKRRELHTPDAPRLARRRQRGGVLDECRAGTPVGAGVKSMARCPIWKRSSASWREKASSHRARGDRDIPGRSGSPYRRAGDEPRAQGVAIPDLTRPRN